MDLFVYRILVAVVVGGGILTLAAYVAEKVKPELGGLINSSPTTMVIATVFIYWTAGTNEAGMGTISLLMGLGGMALVTLFYNHMLKKNKSIFLSTILSIAIWIAVILLMMQVNAIHQFLPSLLFASGATFLLTYFVTFKNKSGAIIAPSKKGKLFYLTRFALGGGIIGVVVFLSHQVGGFWGGLIGGLPIMTLTGIGFVYRNQGAKVAQQFIRTFSIGAWSNIIFLGLTHATLSIAEPAIAIGGSYIVSILGATILYTFFNKKEMKK
jgi:hypothetical protein